MIKLLHIAPFTRMLFFLVTGMLTQNCFDLLGIIPWLFGMAGLLLLISFFSYFYKSYCYRFIFGLGLFIFFFSFGYFNQQSLEDQIVWGFCPQTKLYEVQMIDEPVLKPNSIQCKFRIKNTEEDNISLIGKYIFTYFSRDSISLNFRINDSFIMYAQLNEAPDYLRAHAISAVGFVPDTQWLKIKNKENRISLRMKALSLRTALLERLQRILPDNRHYSIATALMLGYKTDMDKTLRQTFANVGAGHVLAVSGLHFSIIFGIFYSILCFIGNSHRGIILKQLILLPMIWGFAFIINLSPSVIRAATMLSIAGIGRCFRMNPLSINTLSFTAFIMLLFNPLYLYDIGFQLSFSAVLSILLINPYIVKRYETKNKILNYLWNLISVSLSAQIGVLPLSIYYFNQFPLIFLLTNLLIIPLVTILLCIIPICLLINTIFSQFTFLDEILKKVLDYLLSLMVFLDEIPYRSIDLMCNWKLFDLFFCYIIIINLVVFFVKKRIFYASVLFIIVLFWLIYYLCSH